MVPYAEIFYVVALVALIVELYGGEDVCRLCPTKS